jgi:hypothetical protein
VPEYKQRECKHAVLKFHLLSVSIAWRIIIIVGIFTKENIEEIIQVDLIW